ncbi:MAG TPA: prolyl oligopeptidase family serine peptidase, partial [Candidatus Limnocylindria bacterium]|nr:prolyl oligopeptidase family serine peptidase [Candidatus Limnocylindria bacterium]
MPPRSGSATTAAALVGAQVALESFGMAPDGGWLVFALREVYRGRYRSHLWRVPWAGGIPQRLTAGAVRDGSPAISPDGRWIAFRRSGTENDAKPGQVWLMPASGGRARRVTRLRHGAATPCWSPDGTQLAVLGPAGPHRFLVGREVAGRAPTARRITRTDFRDDIEGHLSRRAHLWLVDPFGDSPARQLTSGDFDVAHPAWAPDGSWLAFDCDVSPDANIRPRSVVRRVATDSGAVSELASLPGDAWRPAVSPDGRRVAFIGVEEEDWPDAALPRLWVVPVEGGAPRCLTPGLDRPVACDVWADLLQAEESPGPAWRSDHELVVIVADTGRNLPYRVGLPGGDPEPLVGRDERVVAAGIASAAGRVAIAAALDRRGGDLMAVEEGALRRLTDAGARWQRRFGVPDWEERWVATVAGPMQVWVASPADASGPLPTILHLHGGPIGGFAPGGSMDSTLLCAHGYRVVMPNLRGSASFGAAWTGALGGDWGGVDAADVLRTVDAMIEAGLADPYRLGVMGLSYGGFLTQWLIGVTDRFGAAVAENGVTNQASEWASSYFGIHYNRRARLGDPLTEAGMRQLW